MRVWAQARGRGRLFEKSLPLPLASPTPVKNTGVGDGWKFSPAFFKRRRGVQGASSPLQHGVFLFAVGGDVLDAPFFCASSAKRKSGRSKCRMQSAECKIKGEAFV